MAAPSRIYLSPPHLSGHEIDFVKEAFDTNWVSPVGPHIDAFERDMCAYTGAPHAVALASGTAAIHLSLLLAGVKRGERVACSSFTFAGSAFPIVHLGARPVFIDSDRATWNMDPELLEKALAEGRQRNEPITAVIAVHLYGSPADTDAIADVCRRFDAVLIEDAAESLGARYRGRHTGIDGAFGIYSFNGNKIITTSGGGMLVTHSAEHAARARFLATQARDPAPHYEHTTVGFNYRMSNIVAGIGRAQLSVIEERVSRRREIFEWYRARFEHQSGISFMPEPSFAHANRWLTCMLVDTPAGGPTREDIRLALEAQNIECRPLWKPMHLQPVFAREDSYVSEVSEDLFRIGLCLPSGSAMTEENLERVARVVEGVL